MKRKSKCANKKAYPLRSDALSTAAWWYKHRGVESGIYECPRCLDFHLTTKYCNTKQYHRRWLFALGRELRKEEIRFDNKFFPDGETKKIQKQTEREKRRRIKPENRKLLKIKERYKQREMLTQAEMKEIFATFDATVYPQPKSFWQRFVDIISGTGK